MSSLSLSRPYFHQRLEGITQNENKELLQDIADEVEYKTQAVPKNKDLLKGKYKYPVSYIVFKYNRKVSFIVIYSREKNRKTDGYEKTTCIENYKKISGDLLNKQIEKMVNDLLEPLKRQIDEANK